jgi:threonine dehydratase
MAIVSNNEYLKKILTSSVYDVAIITNLEKANLLSDLTKNEILLKREDMQSIFSFKIRGAYNKIKKLKHLQNNTIICASAGNHAQGCALSAKKMGYNAVIVMPKNTPQIKIEAVKRLDGTIILYGDSFQETQEYAIKLSEENSYEFISPFDDPDIIAGQGTIGMEIVNQMGSQIEELFAIFCPIGGGGLISGIAVYIKQLYKHIKIIGVQSSGADAMNQSMKSNVRVTLNQVDTFSDGTAVKCVGKETFRLCQEHVDEIILVDTIEICAAIKYMFDDKRTILEGAGALSIAGAIKYSKNNNIINKKLIAITSGANINFDKLKFISEKADIQTKSESFLAITIPEKINSLKTFLNSIKSDIIKTVNITQFHYRYSNNTKAVIYFGFSVSNNNNNNNIQVIKNIQNAGYMLQEFNENNNIKSHIPFLTSNYNGKIENEHVFTFCFSERNGALLEFLEKLDIEINISMFHYRNNGELYGNVLMGLQISENKYDNFIELLNKLNITFSIESNNKALHILDI